MKRYLIICCLFLICGLKNVYAQTFPDPPDGTILWIHDNGATNGLEANIDFVNHERVAPVDGINAVVTYAGIEIVGIDANNNEIPIISESTASGQWDGYDYIFGIGSSNDPAIVKVEVILLVQYSDPVNGDYEEEMDYEYYPGVTNFPISIGN